MTPEFNTVALAFLTFALAFVSSLYFFNRNQVAGKAKLLAEEHDRLLARVAVLEGQLLLVNATVLPIATAFQQVLVRQLTHLHEPEADLLLAKIDTLTYEEHQRLAVILQDRYEKPDPLISESEREAAKILPYVNKRAKEEARVLKEASDLNNYRLIAIAAVEPVVALPPAVPVKVDLKI